MHLETWLTFGLAVLAYTLLQAALAAILYLPGAAAGLVASLARRRGLVTWLLLLFGLAHALCVWTLRFEWDFGFAIDKGVPVFVAFHGALALMLLLALRSRYAEDRLRGPAVVLAWLLVASSAVVAPFKYPEISGLQIPIVLLTAVGVALLVAAARARRAA